MSNTSVYAKMTGMKRLCLFIALLMAGCLRRDAGSEQVVTLLNDQLLILATLIGSIAALPVLIEFLVERRKRKERIALSLEDMPVSSIKTRLAGMDQLLTSIEDLIDRARHPKDYASLDVGNEILIVGPPLAGKKTLAQVIARKAELERIITVYNPRNSDALAKAKSLITADDDTKMMLLLPRIDQVFEKEDEEVLTELEALIETTSERANVLVVGTATELLPNGALDNLFGIKLVIPGTRQSDLAAADLDPEMQRVLNEAAKFYVAEARSHGFVLEGITEDAFVARILKVVSNPAEVQDIVTLCQTTSLYRKRTGRQASLRITPEMLELAISRVVVRPINEDE